MLLPFALQGLGSVKHGTDMILVDTDGVYQYDIDMKWISII